MLDGGGYPLRAGEPDYTEDDQFWGGARVHHLTHDDVRKGQGCLLNEADVMVFDLMDCSPGSPRLGSEHLVSTFQRRQILDAGAIRSAELDECLQRWESSAGTVLALLVGEGRSPHPR